MRLWLLRLLIYKWYCIGIIRSGGSCFLSSWSASCIWGAETCLSRRQNRARPSALPTSVLRMRPEEPPEGDLQPSLACSPSGTIPWIPFGDGFQILALQSALSLAKKHWHFTSLIRDTGVPTYQRLHVHRDLREGLKKEARQLHHRICWLLSPSSCLREQPCVAVTPGAERPPDTAPAATWHLWQLTRLPVHVMCLSHGVARQRAFLSLELAGTWKSNAWGEMSRLECCRGTGRNWYFLFRGSVWWWHWEQSWSSSRWKVFLERRENLEGGQLLEADCLQWLFTYTFPSSIKKWIIFVPDLEKHFCSLRFNWRLNLKVASYSFIHILWSYCDGFTCQLHGLFSGLRFEKF